ncbi:cysteine protease Atg4p [[Candida] anglica]|uniref:Cysteine protease n=1 Tax=[Candida] anglica TaxID=148631 RepID=A0ABP0EBT7_9ASCO
MSEVSEEDNLPLKLSQLWHNLIEKQPYVQKSPIVILGRRYVDKEQPQVPDHKIDVDQQAQNLENNKTNLLSSPSFDYSQVESDIRSRIWLTYRTGFEPIPKAVDGPQPLSFVQSMIFNRNLTSTIYNIHSLTDNESFSTDVGWGCMIRTSQSLLANTYQKILLGRDFTYDDMSNSNQTSLKKHNLLIDLFRDSTSAPFSIHNFIKVATESPLQVKPGEWFGPNAASLSIKRLCNKLKLEPNTPNVSIPQIDVIISESSDLYDDVIKSNFNSDTQKPLLVLLPIRLGIEKINSYYYASLFQLLSLNQSVGIAGGKPSSSYYFFGYQGSKFLYLDPHYPQYCQPDDYSTYHTTRYSYLDIQEMDPSMMVGILLMDIKDYYDFKENCTTMGNKIVNFHNTSVSGDSKPKRKMSEFVNITRGDLSSQDEDFVPIDEEIDNDYIDIGEEIENITQEESVTVEKSENNEEPVTVEIDDGFSVRSTSAEIV